MPEAHKPWRARTKAAIASTSARISAWRSPANARTKDAKAGYSSRLITTTNRRLFLRARPLNHRMPAS